jgi:hypothetical protein
VHTARPPASGAALHRSVAACIASILEIDVADVPVPGAEHPEPWTVWRNWLAQRGLGLVPIADPAAFHWPGPWLALLRAADGEGCIGAVAFGAPPGLAWNPPGGSETIEAVERGYLIAPADVALRSASRTSEPRNVVTRGIDLNASSASASRSATSSASASACASHAPTWSA